MPLGLWDGKTAPAVPDWYTEEKFKKEFSKFFNVLLIKKLEENRVLFMGEVV